ncbi:hypothetical protein C2845_PM15G14480 [Panicum miliaceum]|uniref:Uncharacterized protein n=1 Tax=Panicum miliaceum TaxID=4540 RepID=A0A3L6Q919_PANMI|nr:hypothetical protein C2845_PM15G14480 [Panicum miliaceum]
MLMRNSSGSYASFTKRLCARRILCFLKRHYLEGAAHQLERETTVFFDMSHLRFLAASARWDELASYVAWFFPSDDRDPPSIQATTFLHCIHFYRMLAMIPAGGSHAEVVDKLYPLLDDAAAKANPPTASLRAFLHDFRRRQPRDYTTWVQIWQLAAKRLEGLALQCPELEGKLHLPHYTPKRWQINLSGLVLNSLISSVHLNCFVKSNNNNHVFHIYTLLNSLRPILRPYKKEVKQKACDVASFFHGKRVEINRSLAGLSSNGTTDSMVSEVQTEAIVQASVAAGALGGDGERFESKEADNTSTSMKKRKKSETSDITDAEDAATRSVKARKDDASTL